MDEKILWGFIAAVVTVALTFFANFILKHTDFKLNWRKLQIENLKELYGLVVGLQEENRKLFRGSIDPNHDQLRARLVKWLDAYRETRAFYLKNRIIISDNLRSGLSTSVEKLHAIAIEMMKTRNSMDELEARAGGNRIHMYDDEQNEYQQALSTIERLAGTSSLEETFKTIDFIINDIDQEFKKQIKKRNVL